AEIRSRLSRTVARTVAREYSRGDRGPAHGDRSTSREGVRIARRPAVQLPPDVPGERMERARREAAPQDLPDARSRPPLPRPGAARDPWGQAPGADGGHAGRIG